MYIYQQIDTPSYMLWSKENLVIYVIRLSVSNNNDSLCIHE